VITVVFFGAVTLPNTRSNEFVPGIRSSAFSAICVARAGLYSGVGAVVPLIPGKRSVANCFPPSASVGAATVARWIALFASACKLAVSLFLLIEVVFEFFVTSEVRVLALLVTLLSPGCPPPPGEVPDGAIRDWSFVVDFAAVRSFVAAAWYAADFADAGINVSSMKGSTR
jgi:hypothetical protein